MRPENRRWIDSRPNPPPAPSRGIFYAQEAAVKNPDRDWDRTRDGRMADYATDDEPMTVAGGDEEGDD